MRTIPPNILTTLALVALPCGLSAQFSGLLPTTTFPSDHTPNIPAKALVNGASYSHWYPFSNGKMRSLMVYDAHDLKIGHGKTISHVGHQAEKGRKSVGHKIQLKMFMGKTTKTHANALGTFASNYNGPASNVFGGASGKILALPDLGNSLSPNVNTPFLFIPLDTPYTYDSSQNLAVEWQVHANDNGNASWLYTLDYARFIARAKKIGSGCPSSGNVTPTLTSSLTAIGKTYSVYLRRAPASNGAALALSLQPAAAPVQHPAYAAGCNFHIDMGPAALLPVFFLGTTNTSGSLNWSFPVPKDIAFNDFKIYSQCAVSDFFAPGGGVLSDAGMAELGMDPQQTLIYRSGSATASTGTVSRNWGLITHFIHN